MRIEVICLLLFGVLSYCNAAFSEAFSGSNGGGAAASAAASGNGAYSGAFSSSNSRRRPFANSYGRGAAAAVASSGNRGMFQSELSRNGNAFAEAFSGPNGERTFVNSFDEVFPKDEQDGQQISNSLDQFEEVGKYLQVVRQGDGLSADFKNKDLSQILDMLMNLEKNGTSRRSYVKGGSTPASTLDSNVQGSFTPGSIVNTTLASATDSTLSTFFSPLIDIAVHFGLYLDFSMNDSDISEFEDKSFSQIVDMILNLKEQGITPSINVKESAH